MIFALTFVFAAALLITVLTYPVQLFVPITLNKKALPLSVNYILIAVDVVFFTLLFLLLR